MLPERRHVKIALASWTIASIEWYDFFIYGTASALVFPTAFFPARDPLIGTLLSFATFGVAFIARPVGGALFGHIGDSVGRKKALVGALIAMGMATTLIGALPAYTSIGVAAPIALVILRFVQGVAVGGQQGGVIVLATEAVPDRRTGAYGSFASAGAPGGIILANCAFLILASIMTPTMIRDWGWRVPFLTSLLIVAVAVVIQLRLGETPEFRAKFAANAARPRRKSKSPVIEAARRHPRQVLLAAGCYLAINLNYYIFNTFLISYVVGSHIRGLSQAHVLGAVLIASAVELLWLPIAGLLSDEFGRRRVFTLGAALLAAWSFVFWPLVNTGSFVLLLLALVVGLGLLHSTMYGPQPAMFSEAFDTSVRYSGVSLGVQLGSLVGGAFAPFIATALLARFGSATPIAIYMSAGCVITFACGLKLGKHRMTAKNPQPATPTTSDLRWPSQ